MNSKRKKRVSRVKISPEDQLTAYRSLFRMMSISLNDCKTELSRVQGIVSGGTDAESMDDVQHRVKSLKGHVNALREVASVVNLTVESFNRMELPPG